MTITIYHYSSLWITVNQHAVDAREILHHHHQKDGRKPTMGVPPPSTGDFHSQPSIDIHRVPICSHHFEEFPRFSYDFHRFFFIFPIFSYSFLYVPIICPYFPRHKQGKQLPALCISRFTMGDMGTVSAFGASVKPGKWERERTRDMAMNTLW